MIRLLLHIQTKLAHRVLRTLFRLYQVIPVDYIAAGIREQLGIKLTLELFLPLVEIAAQASQPFDAVIMIRTAAHADHGVAGFDAAFVFKCQVILFLDQFHGAIDKVRIGGIVVVFDLSVSIEIMFK